MKFLRLSAMFLAMSAALGVFADAGSTLISFETSSDLYADGTAVKDGEWYALVWTANETFGGLTLDCTPVVAGDEVVFVEKLAKGGRCPTTIFCVSSAKAHADGRYLVYLLDTRDAEGKTAAKDPVKGVPVVFNGSGVAASYAATSVSAGSTAAAAEAAPAAAWAAAAPVLGDGSEAPQPVITGFAVNGATVKVTVENLHPSVMYTVKAGASADKIDTFPIGAKAGVNAVDGRLDFYLDKDQGKFFKVERAPLAK